ncbi:MAG: acyltransferase [Lachnospiraceae bacterium]|nr:acyltransferase [Lachnospiraceae bacterium]
MKKYYKEINIARGIAVLIVLLGHSFPDAEEGFFPALGYKWIYDFCYSFHMAAFFCISGFVNAKYFLAEKSDVFSVLIKKFKRLMIPYLFLSYASLIPKILLNAYARNPVDAYSAWRILLGRSPDGSLWYLYVLFIYCLFTEIVHHFINRLGPKGKSICLSIIAVVFYFIGFFLRFDTETTIERLFGYYIYFVLGIVILLLYQRIKYIFHSGAALCLLVLTAILSCPFIVWKCPYIITAVAGIYVVLSAAIAIEKKEGVLCRAFACCGDNSYAIYILSYYVQQFVRVFCYRYMGWEYLPVVFLEAVLGLILTLYFSVRILPKSRLLRILFVGEWAEDEDKNG